MGIALDGLRSPAMTGNRAFSAGVGGEGVAPSAPRDLAASGMTRSPEAGSMMGTGPRGFAAPWAPAAPPVPLDVGSGIPASTTASPDAGLTMGTAPRGLVGTAGTLDPDRGSTMGIGSRFRSGTAGAAPATTGPPLTMSTRLPVLGSTTSSTLRLVPFSSASGIHN